MPTIQPNNNTSLYNAAGGNTIPINGNITANNINVSNNVNVGGQISATGNITTAGFFIGDGSQLTNVGGTYGNANVVILLNSFGSNTISTTGNVSAGYFLGDGSQLTNLPISNYSNANVANYLPTFTGNLTAGNISAVGQVTGANLKALTDLVVGNPLTDNSTVTNAGLVIVTAPPAGGANVYPGVVSVSNISGSSYMGANISTTGNVTGNYFIGNGSQLTGIATSTYDNSNVATFLAAFGSNTISTTGTVTSGNVIGTNLFTTGVVSATGNVTGNFFIGDGSQLTNLPVGNYSNANVANYLPTFSGNLTAGNISAVGNVTGNYFIGNGSLLTNLPAGNYSNANVANYLPTFSGNLTAGNISASGNIQSNSVIKVGNIQLSGTTAGTIDRIFTLGNIQIGASDKWGSDGDLNISGNLVANTGTAGTGWFNYVVSGNSVNAGGMLQGANIESTGYVSATGNVTGNFFIGNGSLLTNLPSGNYSNANVANYLPTFTGNVGAGNVVLISNTGVVYVNNITGLAGQPMVITADGTEDIHLDADSIRIGDNGQPATITTHGTGNLILRTHEGSAVEGNIILRNGANANIDISPNGTGFVNLAGQVSATGNISAPYYIGDGSLLTNLPIGNYSNANVANYLPTFSGNLAGGNLNITTAGNTWIVSNDQLIAPSGGFWQSNAATNDDYISGNPGGYLNLQALHANNAQASNVHLEQTLVHISAESDTWTFENGNITLPGNTSAINYANGVSILNGISGNYGNSNVATFLAAFGSNTISTTGTVTSGNITGSNIVTAGIITATGNLTAGNILTAGVMSAAGANVGNALWLDSAGAAAIRSNGANLFISNLGNTTTTVRLGGSATTISVGNTSNTSIQANTTITMGGLVNIIGGANVGGAAGLNVNNGANIVISSGNLTIGGNAGIAYIKTTSATGYVFNTANIIYIGNQSSNTGNAIFSGNIVGNLAISATGNISTNSFITVKSYTVAALTAITGSIGQQAAVSDATPGGRMAFWDTTNSRWSYINDNSAV
jgi:hypothetical protein